MRITTGTETMLSGDNSISVIPPTCGTGDFLAIWVCPVDGLWYSDHPRDFYGDGSWDLYTSTYALGSLWVKGTPCVGTEGGVPLSFPIASHIGVTKYMMYVAISRPDLDPDSIVVAADSGTGATKTLDDQANTVFAWRTSSVADASYPDLTGLRHNTASDTETVTDAIGPTYYYAAVGDTRFGGSVGFSTGPTVSWRTWTISTMDLNDPKPHTRLRKVTTKALPYTLTTAQVREKGRL